MVESLDTESTGLGELAGNPVVVKFHISDAAGVSISGVERSVSPFQGVGAWLKHGMEISKRIYTPFFQILIAVDKEREVVVGLVVGRAGDDALEIED